MSLTFEVKWIKIKILTDMYALLLCLEKSDDYIKHKVELNPKQKSYQF